MSERVFNELSKIKGALETLKKYNEHIWFSVDEKTFEDPLLVEYFESPLDDPVEARVEKIIGAAAVRAVYDNPHLSASEKKRVAETNARDLRNAMRMAKLDYLAHVKECISVPVYNRRKKANELVQRIAKIKYLKRIRRGLTIRGLADLLTTLVGLPPVGGWVITAGRMAWNLMPEKVRKPLERKAKKIKEQAVTTIQRCCETIKKSKVGQAVAKVVEKAKPYYEKAKDVVIVIKEKTKAKVKALLSKIV